MPGGRLVQVCSALRCDVMRPTDKWEIEMLGGRARLRMRMRLRWGGMRSSKGRKKAGGRNGKNAEAGQIGGDLARGCTKGAAKSRANKFAW